MRRRIYIRAVLGLTALAAAAALPGPAESQSVADRLAIHGFMTQAYGRSDGHQRLGIPSEGTSDYRVAALQFRYDAGTNNAFVMQLSHERLGHSPLADREPEVDLDWVFYEHRFGDNTVARVGKIRTPTGLYNEIRDVGTLLPLYRPPVTMYGEQTYTAETLDGVMLGQRIPLGDWALNVEGFFGGWTYVQYDLVSEGHIDAGIGAQAWLDTPLEGLRVGAGAISFTANEESPSPEPVVDDRLLWLTSVEAIFRPLTLRAEYYHTSLGGGDLAFDGGAQGYYGQVVFDVTEQVGVVGQAEWADLSLDIPGPMGFTFDGNLDRDLALGLRFAPTLNLVLKLEGHLYRGHSAEDLLPVAFWVTDPTPITYGLLSVSTSF